MIFVVGKQAFIQFSMLPFTTQPKDRSKIWLTKQRKEMRESKDLLKANIFHSKRD